MILLKGVIVPTITPLKGKNQDKIDEVALERLCNFLISKGVHGLYPCGTTGEAYLLPKGLRKELARLVVEKVSKRIPVVIQTGCIDTKSTIELTKHAKNIGADGAGVVSPYFYHYSDDSLKKHYVAVARSVPGFPIYIYNLPGNTNNNITPELMKAILDEADNIVGMKYSSADIKWIPEYCSYLGKNRVFLVGDDQLIYSALVMGASGCIAGNANVFPEPFVSLYNNVMKGNHEEAKKDQYLISKIAVALGMGAHISAFKTGLRFRGIDTGPVVPPQKSFTEKEAMSLCRELKSLSLPLGNPIC
ncbi:MAG: dihydrodipicolinate synthase family protein [Candidatus Aerophobetes bacterium]|nr:dihydrodipicolinate synthase family protein [Candidatus Aerophobetes bacterium]